MNGTSTIASLLTLVQILLSLKCNDQQCYVCSLDYTFLSSPMRYEQIKLANDKTILCSFLSLLIDVFELLT